MERTSNGSLRPFYNAGRANTICLAASPLAGPASTTHPASSVPSFVALPAAIHSAGSTSSVIAADVTLAVVTSFIGSHLAVSSLSAATVPSPSVVSLSSAAVYTAAGISVSDPKLISQPTTNQQKNLLGES